MKRLWRKLVCGFFGHSLDLQSAVDWLDEERRPRFRRLYFCGRRCGWELQIMDLETTTELAIAMRLAAEKELNRDYNAVSGIDDVQLKP